MDPKIMIVWVFIWSALMAWGIYEVKRSYKIQNKFTIPVRTGILVTLCSFTKTIGLCLGFLWSAKPNSSHQLITFITNLPSFFLLCAFLLVVLYWIQTYIDPNYLIENKKISNKFIGIYCFVMIVHMTFLLLVSCTESTALAGTLLYKASRDMARLYSTVVSLTLAATFIIYGFLNGKDHMYSLRYYIAGTILGITFLGNGINVFLVSFVIPIITPKQVIIVTFMDNFFDAIVCWEIVYLLYTDSIVTLYKRKLQVESKVSISNTTSSTMGSLNQQQHHHHHHDIKSPMSISTDQETDIQDIISLQTSSSSSSLSSDSSATRRNMINDLIRDRHIPLSAQIVNDNGSNSNSNNSNNKKNSTPKMNSKVPDGILPDDLDNETMTKIILGTDDIQEMPEGLDFIDMIYIHNQRKLDQSNNHHQNHTFNINNNSNNNITAQVRNSQSKRGSPRIQSTKPIPTFDPTIIMDPEHLFTTSASPNKNQHIINIMEGMSPVFHHASTTATTKGYDDFYFNNLNYRRYEDIHHELK